MESASPVFSGVGVALITVFGEGGELRPEESAAHAGQLVEEGVRAVVVAGTTGEAMTLEPEERTRLLRAVRGAVGGRVPVIAGTGAPSARQAVALSRRAAEDGADAVLALSPPGAADPRAYYEQIAAAIELPLLGYHFPQVSPPGVPLGGLGGLPIDGLKDSSGEAERLVLEAEEVPVGLYVGQHSLLLLAGAIGCSGAILGLANVDVAGCARAWEGDAEAQRRLVADHTDLATIPALKRRVSSLRGTDPAARIG
jgi:4-hydroxy-tetrahydrodipicolinate synthase